ncbi:uncharacterized protein LOC112452252 [Temnothorax curvispinosus]|uniref:Uncharacterized protein LOC112452252 n=1 Tax=Temnothorax curvispinosus TaxID=300111 RepID=A0A6J1PF23_9HYME|nr:uncharacterized protein LOC112452252 [Temnothorax curvispinosus]
MIFQERTVAQLKKLWTNMKQNQRELLTKEKQARLATGGGPPLPETNIDPDVAAIAPHLLETAPILFTSNMTDNEIKEMKKQTLKIVTDNDSTIVISESNDDEATNENKIQEVDVTIEDTTQDKENQNIDFSIQAGVLKRKKGLDTVCKRNTKMTKVETNITETSLNNESTVKIERIKQIIEQEKEVAEIQKAHEKRMAVLKENFHNKIHALEIRTATAKAELAELQLRKEKEKYASSRA